MAAHPASWLTSDRFWGLLKFLGAAVVSTIIGAVFAYLYTAQLNKESAIQQQYLAAVQDFVATGARVDASVTGLADSVLDKDGVKEGRKEARQAIAAHVAATLSLQQVIGEGNAREYMKGLATLRTLIDEADDVGSALAASQARFDVMENRTIIVAEARRRIYEGS